MPKSCHQYRHSGFQYAGLITLCTQAVFTLAAFLEICLRYCALVLIIKFLMQSYFGCITFYFIAWLVQLHNSIFLFRLNFITLLLFDIISGPPFRRNGQLSHYVIAAFLNFAGMYCTNVSLNYIHYILRVVFKSSRLLPVMVWCI